MFNIISVRSFCFVLFNHFLIDSSSLTLLLFLSFQFVRNTH